MTDLKALLQRMYDEMGSSGTDIDAMIDEYLAEDFVEHEEVPGMGNTRESPRQLFKMMRGAFPDLRMNSEDLIQEGDKVVARFTMTGTHRGEFMGVPASGNKIEVKGIDILQHRGDKFVAHWGMMDMAVMMEQMGATGHPG